MTLAPIAAAPAAVQTTAPRAPERNHVSHVGQGMIAIICMRWIPAVILALVFAAPALAAGKPPAASRVSQITGAQSTPDERARQWLVLLDDGDYARGWQEAGPAMKDHQTAAAWTAATRAAREPLGAMANRNLKSIELVSLDKAVVRYDSVFAHKAAAVETVTLGLANGGWSVTGYSIN